MRLVPDDPAASPLTIVFDAFPGLIVRMGSVGGTSVGTGRRTVPATLALRSTLTNSPTYALLCRTAHSAGHPGVSDDGRMPDNMTRLEQIVDRLPEAARVDVEEWGGHPTFRVRGKNFVFSDAAAENLSVKLPVAEAAAVVATDDQVSPAGYGLGTHGWIAFTLRSEEDDARWVQVEEWVRTSYSLVAPKSLARRLAE